MAKVRIEKEWRLWAGLGACLLILIGYLYFVSRPPMEGGEYLWQVTKVVEGTTLKLKGSGQTIEFHIVGLEIPPDQAEAARQRLEQLVQDKWIRIKTLRSPKEGVQEGLIFLSGEDVQARIVRQGLAKVDRSEKGLDVRPYMELELEAKREKKGLWTNSPAGAK